MDHRQNPNQVSVTLPPFYRDLVSKMVKNLGLSPNQRSNVIRQCIMAAWKAGFGQKVEPKTWQEEH